VDEAVEAVLTLPGYTSGRFNRTEVFELPFIMQDSVATSQALYTAAFVLAMKWDAYEEMHKDLQAILDAETAITLSQMAGKVMAGADTFWHRRPSRTGSRWL